MARNKTHFEFADRGPVSVYKFTFAGDPNFYVWFEYGGGEGSLHTTPRSGPYRADDPLGDAPFAGLEELLAAKGTTKEEWVDDLMAQYGECLSWTYP